MLKLRAFLGILFLFMAHPAFAWDYFPNAGTPVRDAMNRIAALNAQISALRFDIKAHADKILDIEQNLATVQGHINENSTDQQLESDSEKLLTNLIPMLTKDLGQDAALETLADQIRQMQAQAPAEALSQNFQKILNGGGITDLSIKARLKDLVDIFSALETGQAGFMQSEAAIFDDILKQKQPLAASILQQITQMNNRILVHISEKRASAVQLSVQAQGMRDEIQCHKNQISIDGNRIISLENEMKR